MNFIFTYKQNNRLFWEKLIFYTFNCFHDFFNEVSFFKLIAFSFCKNIGKFQKSFPMYTFYILKHFAIGNLIITKYWKSESVIWKKFSNVVLKLEQKCIVVVNIGGNCHWAYIFTKMWLDQNSKTIAQLKYQN